MSGTEDRSANEYYDPILGALVAGTKPVIDLNHIVGIAVMADRTALAALDGQDAFKEGISDFCAAKGFPIRSDYKTIEMKHARLGDPENLRDLLYFNLKFNESYPLAKKAEIEQLATEIDKIPEIMFDRALTSVADHANNEWQKKIDNSRYLPALENAELIKAGNGKHYSAIEVTARAEWLPTLRDKLAFASAVGDFMFTKGCVTRIDSHSTLNAPIRKTPGHPDEFVFIFPVDSKSGEDESKMKQLQQELAAIPKTSLNSGNVEL